MIIRNSTFGLSLALVASLVACAEAPVEDGSTSPANDDESAQLGVTSAALVTACPLNGATSITLRNLDSTTSATTFKVTDRTGTRSISVGVGRTVAAPVSGTSVSVDVPLAKGYTNTTSCPALFFVGASRYSGK